MRDDVNRWRERELTCTSCGDGTETTIRKGINGTVTKHRHPCHTCFGTQLVVKNVPEFCQYDDCNLPAVHQCSGVLCDQHWVCDGHWKPEDTGFSPNGFACETCWDEVGSSGH